MAKQNSNTNAEAVKAAGTVDTADTNQGTENQNQENINPNQEDVHTPKFAVVQKGTPEYDELRRDIVTDVLDGMKELLDALKNTNAQHPVNQTADVQKEYIPKEKKVKPKN